MNEKVGRAGSKIETMIIFDATPMHRHPRKISEQLSMRAVGAEKLTSTIRRVTEVRKNNLVTTAPTLAEVSQIRN